MRNTLMVAGMISALATPALAQSDPMAQVHQAAANQLGMMEYCKAQGFVGDDVLTAQRSAMAQLPPSTVSTAAAEAAGKDGAMLAPNGTRTTLASMAASQGGGTVSDLCKKMGDAIVQSAAMMKNMPAATQMPAGMPSMPGGMPTMPAMPGAAPK